MFVHQKHSKNSYQMNLLLSLLILSVSIVSATVEAKEISVQKATDLACYYVNQKTTLRQGVSIKLAYTAPSSSCRGLTDYYAFNVGDNQGFILVSADDAVAPILGWCMEGCFDLERMPSNLLFLLKGYQTEIAALRQVGTLYNEVSEVGLTQEEEVLLKTAVWGQGAAYNRYTPQVDGQSTLTGCVAIAAGIIMHYHRYPDQVMDGILEYYGVPVDYEPIQWSKMSYQTPWSETTQEAVGSLLWQIGANANLTYGIKETTGRIDSVFYCMKNHFGYSCSARLLVENALTEQAWNDLLHAEIDAKRPVLYSAQDDQQSIGHAFVIDGYKGQNYYHVNWGWDGQFNGDFRLHAFDPNPKEQYNANQIMCIGLQPAKADDQPVGELAYRLWKSDYRSGTTNFKIQLEVVNTGSSTFEGAVGIGLYKVGEANPKVISGICKLQDLSEGVDVVSLTLDCLLEMPLEEGQIIRPVWQDLNGQWHSMRQGKDQPWGITFEGEVQDSPSVTAVSTPKSLVSWYVHDGGITIDSQTPQSYRIFALQGKLLKDGIVNGRMILPLAKGIYVLTIGALSYTVII